MPSRKQIEKYWENPGTVSLIDKNLRVLETDFVLNQLSGIDEVADFGCGDGESTVYYAKKVKSMLAVEQSRYLRKLAAARFKEAKLTNIKLVSGDVMNLSDYTGKFNTVITQRVVINFMTWDEQQKVISNIWKTLRPGGRYIMIENTFEGFEALNSVRRKVGLSNIPLHDWHNYFLHYDNFIKFIDEKFVIEKTQTFNLYYLLTRVFTNMFAKFEGWGTGAKKDTIFDIADKSARKLQELLNDQIEIKVKTGNSFGPIQGWVLRRMG
jgi:ubiquinone/menaquinone biosynthesis C-methylase UbiE